VSPERDEPIEDQEHELYEDVPPRSIFAATWFRVVLVVIVLGVVGAVAVPYLLDWMNPPPAPRTIASTKSPIASSPSTMSPTSEKSPSDKPLGEKSVAEKKDSSTMIPAPVASSPVAPSLASPPARTEPKTESKSESKSSTAVPPARPADPRPTAETKPGPKAVVPEPKRGPAQSESKSSDAKTQSAMAVTDSPAKSSPAKPSAAKPESTAKGDTTQATATKPPTPQRAVAKATTPSAAASVGGPYWVQIGAFRDADTAKRIAAKLRDENFKVEESVKRIGGSTPAASAPAAKASAPAPSGTDQYDVFVTGMSLEELNKRLAGKGLSGEASGNGVVVKPSQPLRDAVALSKDLAVEGFKVQVRRAGGGASAPAIVSAPTPAPATEGEQSLHRVRVGAFTDKAAALAAARELESKGFKPYIARGDQ
jgi:sporulation related protein